MGNLKEHQINGWIECDECHVLAPVENLYFLSYGTYCDNCVEKMRRTLNGKDIESHSIDTHRVAV